MIVAVDFDATLVKEEWPYAGDPVEGAFEVLHKLQKAGHKIILLTQREHASVPGCADVLQVALDIIKSHGITLYSINSLPLKDEFLFPSRKVYADVYIDDHCIGIDLIPYTNKAGEYSPYVNWKKVDKWFIEHGYYKKGD